MEQPEVAVAVEEPVARVGDGQPLLTQPAERSGHVRRVAPPAADAVAGAPEPDGAPRVHGAVSVQEAGSAPVLPGPEAERFRRWWADVQATFVDDPRAAVHAANGLVGEVLQELTRAYGRQRAALEGEWSRSANGDTEQLRKVLQRYRAFFQRLLST